MEFDADKEGDMDIKCGEVFLSKSGNLILICTVCDIKFTEFPEYAEHTKNHFLVDVLNKDEKEFQPVASHDDSNSYSIENEYLEDYEELEDGCQLIEEIKLLEPFEDVSDNVEEESNDTVNSNDAGNVVEEYKYTMNCMGAVELVEEFPTETSPMNKFPENKIYLSSAEPVRPDGSTIKELIYNCATHPLLPSKTRFYCYECDKGFYSRTGYRSHSRIHTGERKYKCSREDCKQSFITFYAYRKHTQVCMGKSEIECLECGRVFNDRQTYRKHTKTHGLPFKCKKCNFSVKTAKSLELHMQSHKVKQKTNCQLCSSSFENHSDLLTHLESKHSGVAQFQISISRKN